MPTATRSSRFRRSIKDLRSDWVEVGGLGRLAVVGTVLALVVTVVLGFSITRSARGHLLDARAAMVAASVESLPSFPTDGEKSPAEYSEFDAAVRVSVLGGETVRVKVWSDDGVIVYSDAPELIGRQFDLPEHAALAFAADEEAHISDLSDPAHALDRGRGELIEFYIPMLTGDGSVPFVVEVEQDASGLNHALGQIARNVWVSIGIGLFAIAAHAAQQKTKEIGVRKSHGASSKSVIFRFVTIYLRWVLLANLLAWPIAFILMQKWLENFAYQVSISIWVFILAAVISIIISVMTISWHAWNISNTNPVNSLRYE